MSEEELENPVVAVTAIPVTPSVAAPIDKINNLVQKEITMKRVGVTREKYLRIIAEEMEATGYFDEYDDQGNCRRVLKPHPARRQWAAEKAAQLFGDMIERKEIEHDLGDKTLDRFRTLSVAELKQKAAEILQGKTISRISPIDV